MSVISDQLNNCDVHLHAEIEVLKQALVEKQNQLIAMETACLRESDRQVELEDSIIAWQDKYDRLYESHKRVQKVNQNLEDKLLKLVDRNSGERAQLTSDVATLSVRLAQANYNIAKLQREIERYKTDINLAIQLLQCKPDSFVPQKVSSLPMDIQSKVSSYMRLETNSHSDSEGSISGVGVATSGSYKVLPVSDSPPPMCPFPPTAMVYSMRGLDAQNGEISENSGEMISPSIIAKYLEDELKASELKHCDTCNCATKDLTVLAEEPKTYSIGTQTIVQGDANNSLCLRCNSNLNSPSRTNSPYIMKLVKSSDSVISETKSSVSDLNDNEKLFTPAKKDDLMVNPILGHHRLCDRTMNKQQQQLCDTAKYIIETRKLENELIDTRKYNNKSPNTISVSDVSTALNVTTINEKKLIEGNRQINTTKMLLESEIDAIEDDLVKSKNDLSMIDKKSEVKPLESSSSGASGYASAEKESSRAAITGSTNSLWSKTSSSEGAKLFENFNRNLIKTIKAENPKHRGPRLCALRIQNGSNNILLDNMESEVTPIVYTRRQRFLDEELDDTKDVITSKSSFLNEYNHENCPEANLCTSGISNAIDIGIIDDCNKTDNEKYCDVVHSKDVINNNLPLDLDEARENEIMNKMMMMSPIDHSEMSNDQNLSAITGIASGISHVNGVIDHLGGAMSGPYIPNGLIASQQKLQYQQQSYDILNTCDNSNNSSCKNTKSCTQSSSISSNCADVDIQESAMLRRQQLTRVAEWVQNNSQIDPANVNLNHKSNIINNNVINSGNEINNSNNSHHGEVCTSDHSPNNNTCSRTTDANDMSSPMSQNSCSSIERLSMDSGYKTTKQLQNGYYNAINNNIPPATKTTMLTNIQLYKHSQQYTDDNKLITNYHHNCLDGNDVLAQNGYRKYYIDENNKIISIQHPVQNLSNVVGQQMHHQQVDLAQMEYNVKQFLLKQNEWSIANNGNNKSTTSSSISCGKKSTVVSNCNSSSCNDSMISIQNHPHRTETNL